MSSNITLNSNFVHNRIGMFQTKYGVSNGIKSAIKRSYVKSLLVGKLFLGLLSLLSIILKIKYELSPLVGEGRNIFFKETIC